MEAIPEDLKADLAKEPTVEVILGQTFRVWFDGQSAHDYWVRMTSDGLLLSPTRTSEATPGCLCQGNFYQQIVKLEFWLEIEKRTSNLPVSNLKIAPNIFNYSGSSKLGDFK